MRVDVLKIWNLEALNMVLILFAVASITKILSGYLGARMGGLRNAEALVTGLGVNMKGGSDVIVAILGGSLGLLPETTYSMYAVVAILTVLLSPPLIKLLGAKVAPTKQESERLIKEEAKNRAYLSNVERVLLPALDVLKPSECIPILRSIAVTRK